MRELAEFNKSCKQIGFGSGRNVLIRPAHGGRNPSLICASLCDNIKFPLLSIRAAQWQTALCKTRLFAGQTGNVRAENTFAALILIGCRDVKQLRSVNEVVLLKCEDYFYIWSTTRTSNIYIPFILTTFVCIHWRTLADHFVATPFHTIVSCYISVKQFFLIK